MLSSIVFSVLIVDLCVQEGVQAVNLVKRNGKFVPEHNEVFALFMEQPWLNFIRSLTSEEVRALESFKTNHHRMHYSDEEFSHGLGKFSKSAQEKFDKMLIENQKLEGSLRGNAKAVVEEVRTFLKPIFKVLRSTTRSKTWTKSSREKISGNGL
ncbi:hypothetical protein L596_023250 [Steinernema carpocapsae]|uniref:Cathepsin propeptide inhibitor domain-containing protein n=1 Tax=Steinernema carpocapsae TaxID=34508 RepID=A0A4U5MD30_STECR|nr:hypothetical protein L596_023250 [Steinernema carpocapsae]